MQDSDTTRREFLKQGVYAGFALATLPITAWAITTPSDDIVAGEIEIPTEGGPMPGYRAMPKGKGHFPVVLVVHEIFGVHEYIQDVCRRLAKHGYCAVAPYLYFREGDVTHLKTIDEIREKVVSKVQMQRVLTDLDAAAKWAASHGGDAKRLSITGFCWGGMVVWLYSAHNAHVKSGVAWYGRLTPEVLDAGSKLHAPVLGLYGGKDHGIPLTDVEKMRGVLKNAHSKSEIVVYPEAEHGFHADYRPSYNEAAAKDGWAKTLAWLKR